MFFNRYMRFSPRTYLLNRHWNRSFASHIISSHHESIPEPKDTTLYQILKKQVPERGDRTALICGLTDKTLSYKDLLTNIEKTATVLTQMGVQKGDVVTTNSINCFEFPILYYALTSIGGILSTASPQFGSSEILNQLDLSKTKYVVTHAAVKDPAIEACQKYGIPSNRIFCIGDNKKSDQYLPFSDLQNIDESDIKIPNVSIDPKNDINALFFSSGTTGPPKGVELSFFNLVVNTKQISAIEKFEHSLLGLLPMFHIYAFILFEVAMYQGVSVVILPQFEPESFLRVLQTYKIPKAHIVPPIALFLAKHPLVDKYDLSNTKYIISAAAPLGSDVEKQVKDRLNIQVKQAYGMTELSPCTHYTTDTNIREGSIGHLVPNTELRIVCTESGKDLPRGECGELWIRGPQVMMGYKDNPEANKNTIMPDGFLRTGDIGYVDEDGYAFIVDRFKELIKYKGHQIAPAELEHILVSHPSIVDAACIRGKDNDGNEIPKAVVVLQENTQISKEEIINFVSNQVAPFKKIRQISFVDTIPRTGTGKILRRELQKLENEKKLP